MQNTTATSVSTKKSAAAQRAVVQNDTSTPVVPSIALDKLGIAVNLKVANQAPADLAAMERARISWEKTELATSNKRLYAILTDAYSYYLVMKQDSDKDMRKARMEALDQFIAERKYSFMPSSHDMTRVVKCVFGVDRRRVSAYSIALREALRMGIEAEDLTAFIEENGGVEQIRLGGSKPLSVTKRAEMAKNEVLGTDLGMLKFDPVMFAADADWADKQVVIVATYLPTGEFQANAVIKHDSAVNAALAAFYSQQQAKLRESAKSEHDAEKAAAAEAKAEAAARKKQEAAEKQKADAEAAKANAEKKAVVDAHVDCLLEEQQA